MRTRGLHKENIARGRSSLSCQENLMADQHRTCGLIFVLVVCYLFTLSASADMQASYQSLWHGKVLRSATTADAMLKHIPQANRLGRVLMPMLSSYPGQLCCMLKNFYSNVVPSNQAVDIFVFSKENITGEKFKQQQPCRNVTFPNLYFMALDEQWKIPRGSAAIPAFWSTASGHEYRMMGHWRLTFQFAFADLLGYRYLWQLDDDSEFKQPLNIDMMKHMSSNNYWVGGLNHGSDLRHVTWGLPELAKSFLVAERLEPKGPLFHNHTKPPGFEGLFTTKSLAPRDSIWNSSRSGLNPKYHADGTVGGWSREVLHGNNILMDLSFWFQEEVQRFLELVVNTKYHYRFRWNEQSVYGMMWHLFVPNERLWNMEKQMMMYKHPHKGWKCTS